MRGRDPDVWVGLLVLVLVLVSVKHAQLIKGRRIHTDFFEEDQAEGEREQGQSSTNEGGYCIGMRLPKAAWENCGPLLRGVSEDATDKGSSQYD
jgi:hypothetical protein